MKIKIVAFLCFIFQTLIIVQLSQMSNPSDILIMQTTPFTAQFKHVMSQWTEADYQFLLNHYYYDFIYPFLYGYFFYLLLKVAKPLANQWILLFPPVAALADEIENIGHLFVVLNPEPFSLSMWAMALTAAWIKWTCIAIISFLIIHGLLSERNDCVAVVITSDRE